MRPITKSPRLAMLAAFAGAIAATLLVATPAYADDWMQRFYNPNSGEHFYTHDDAEAYSLKQAGWNYEGYGWIAPGKSNTPVYRLYSGTDHHYTTSMSENLALQNAGWIYEGIGWYSDDAQGVPLYRHFNPNVNPKAATNNSGSHHYTKDENESKNIVSVGWIYEGIGWYGVVPEDREARAIEDAKALYAEIGNSLPYQAFCDELMNRYGYDPSDAEDAAKQSGVDWYRATSEYLFKKINERRTEAGLNKLTWDESIYQLESDRLTELFDYNGSYLEGFPETPEGYTEALDWEYWKGVVNVNKIPDEDLVDRYLRDWEHKNADGVPNNGETYLDPDATTGAAVVKMGWIYGNSPYKQNYTAWAGVLIK